MAKNILYILGAGASAKALPIVEEMPIRMKIWFFYLIINQLKSQEELSAIKNTIEKIEEARSFDTYAKEIFLKEDVNDTRETNKLKDILTEYLNFEQNKTDDDIRIELEKSGKITSGGIDVNLIAFIKSREHYDNLNDKLEHVLRESSIKIIFSKIYYHLDKKTVFDILKYIFDYDENLSFKNRKDKLDKRYTNFLIDILGNGSESLKKIKIISWNYDTQVKNAITELKIEQNETKQNTGILEILEKIEIKINGSINTGKINFAWENHTDENNILGENISEDYLQKVQDAVIIGYSFPFSNRKQDIYILKKIFRGSIFLKNLYIQTINDERFSEIKESLESILVEINYGPYINDQGNEEWSKKIIKKINNNSFFIPPHY